MNWIQCELILEQFTDDYSVDLKIGKGMLISGQLFHRNWNAHAFFQTFPLAHFNNILMCTSHVENIKWTNHLTGSNFDHVIVSFLFSKIIIREELFIYVKRIVGMFSLFIYFICSFSEYQIVANILGNNSLFFILILFQIKLTVSWSVNQTNTITFIINYNVRSHIYVLNNENILTSLCI